MISRLCFSGLVAFFLGYFVECDYFISEKSANVTIDRIDV